jgi:hypothetical protein
MIAGARRFVRPPLVAGILLLALIAFASRACDQSRVSVSQTEAVATARTQIDYPPDGHNVRFLRRGLTQHPYWAVSLWTRRPDGDGYERVTVVVVDARSGEVSEITRGASGA